MLDDQVDTAAFCQPAGLPELYNDDCIAIARYINASFVLFAFFSMTSLSLRFSSFCVHGSLYFLLSIVVLGPPVLRPLLTWTV